MEQQKVSLTIPRDVREKIEAERRQMSERVGADLSFNQCATALLRRALDGHRNDFQPASPG
ncbi:hypothetical protein GWC77_25300 [Paraburkholderia sp. NMBU_R16]|uniref:hypothetical protein n=1 Tax=Paraburkholderia sp. NMBU_R16 TaxID=2698676 RepID=UPI001563C2D0|nr:hypothetical protein [Paraburkholderia sp. NMBU_R16]NRO99215.1 hypothetical protein [Paraburkholderia sp. NMBU_R16]